MLFDLMDNARINMRKMNAIKDIHGKNKNKRNMPKKPHTFLSINMIQVVCRVLYDTLTN